MTHEPCINSAPGQDDEVGQRADSVTTELADHARAEIEEWKSFLEEVRLLKT